MSTAFQRYWETPEAELDGDGDGRITLEEYRACVLAPERFAGTVREFARAPAALGDPDGDGVIERPLFTALMRAVGFAGPNIEALFDAFGPDGGGPDRGGDVGSGDRGLLRAGQGGDSGGPPGGRGGLRRARVGERGGPG